MKRSLAVLVLSLLSFLLLGPFSHAYEPARFIYPARAERLRALQPEIQRTYHEFARSNQIPGLAFGIVLDGQLILSGAYGTAQIDPKIPASQKTLFRIASMSKSFAAMAIFTYGTAGSSASMIPPKNIFQS